ncbi:MAG: SWIM zinc finger family protein [Corynebacterium sp.]|nr:SWIM zinc finger family protein [Corynebacterium sp.]
MSQERKRPRVGNVIYANFGAKKQSVARTTPMQQRRSVPAEKQRPAARWLLDIVERRTDVGRLKRGVDYYNKGHVLNVVIANGVIRADVAGSQNVPFTASLSFPYRSDEDIAGLIGELAELPNVMAQLRAGEVPAAALGVLLSENPFDVRLRCDCPDRGDACKHIVAAAYAAAERMLANPETVFALRALNLGEVEHAMLLHAQEHSAQSADSDTERFWVGRAWPDIPQLSVQPALADSDDQLLHKAMRVISYTSVDELRAVSDIEDLYYGLTHDT